MNKFINANADACIGCKTCEIACVLAHGEEIKTLESAYFNARLRVIEVGDITVPVMCHQCEDAPCMLACPNGAIIRQNYHIEVLQEKCIGCKTCVLACPFGAMKVKLKTQDLIVAGHVRGKRYKAQAIKCDICYTDSKGPACVRACPTDALSLVDPEELVKIQETRQLESIFRHVKSSSL
ncbi:4Fe-4S binding protein [Orbus sturtevantii]|uniref:4Fe-4S dicluster domain-containing protein n=1 Tax=Orbus sturtevantii TaxID=3074109 RepID=UPI00370D198A